MSVSSTGQEGATQLQLQDEVSVRPGRLPERGVVAAAVALGADSFGGPLSSAELRLVRRAEPDSDQGARVREAILAGGDPLGEAISNARDARSKRAKGAIYTPQVIVRSMVTWTLEQDISRVIDPGCGSGRFAAEVVRSNPRMGIVAIDVDPVATLAARATLGTLGAKDARVIHGDYTRLRLPEHDDKTAFVGNPPYVRHHQLEPGQKRWAKETAEELGLPWSGLAGLHAHFFLATLLNARQGDVGCFITSAEWLDIGYGKAIRQALLNGMGLLGLHRLAAEAVAFEDAMTTAVVTCFELGTTSRQVRVRSVRTPHALRNLDAGGRMLSRTSLANRPRWSHLFLQGRRASIEATVPLGEIARVSRGAVTGANSFFVLRRAEAETLQLDKWCVPVLAAAEEVFRDPGLVRATPHHRLLLDPARDLDLRTADATPLRRYLRMGERDGVTDRYVCRHRNPWWHVGAKRPPIVATYMARQAPAFALNPDGLAILNVLHGLFPRIDLDEEQLTGLVGYLNANRDTFRGAGRTYQGGLEKFEPREMEALEVPSPERLRAYASG